MNDVNLKSCNYGYAVFQKKPEYDVAKIIVKGSKEEQIKEMFLIDEGSEIIFNGEKKTSSKEIDIDSLYITF